MWRDLTMQQKSQLMQTTGIFDPVRLRLEYDAYLDGLDGFDRSNGMSDEHEYAKGGGIHIKPSHRGRLTELKKRTGKSEAELYRTGSAATRKMITFARNARKWHHSDGGEIPISEFGLWEYPGQIVDVPSNRITMKGVDYPVLGVSNTGDRKVMLPNAEYLFDGDVVREYPLVHKNQYGGLMKPFSYTDIPAVRYGNGGNMFQEAGQMRIGNPELLLQNKYLNYEPIQDNTALQTPVVTRQMKNEYSDSHIGLAEEFGTVGQAENTNAFQREVRQIRNSDNPMWFGAYSVPYLGNALIGANAAERFMSDQYGQGLVDIGLSVLPTAQKFIKQTRRFVLPENTVSYRYGNNNILSNNTRQGMSISGRNFVYPDFTDYPQVNILRSEKPDLNVGNYLERHQARIASKYGENALDDVVHVFDINRSIEDRNKLTEIWRQYFKNNGYNDTDAEREAESFVLQSMIQPGYVLNKPNTPRTILVNRDIVKAKPSTKQSVDKYGIDNTVNSLISHEDEHLVHIPSEKIDNSVFDTMRIEPELRRYFTDDNSTELAARGSQIKDYFNSDTITENKLRHAARNFVKDTGMNNNMDAFFAGIVDWDKMAKWLTKESSAIAIPAILSTFAGNKKKSDGKQSGKN